MKVSKWVGVILASYVAFVVLLETVFLGWYQSTLDATGIPSPSPVLPAPSPRRRRSF